MKFLSFRVRGVSRYGVSDGNKVIDLTERLKYPDLKSMIAADARAEAERAAKGASADYTLDQITFDPTIPNPDKIICVGLNYHEHLNETGLTKHAYPSIFGRWADTQVGHLQPMVLPNNCDTFDYEAELVAIIGKHGRHIKAADAMNYIAGWSCYNEGSIRDFQRHSSQWTPGKNFPGTGAFGPFMVTPDEVGELKGKRIQTRLNGKVEQSSTLDMMIHSPAKLIEYISSFAPLSPGDVIVTGTPGGVGWVRTPPLWMKVGDIVEVEIEGVGLLKNTIAAED
jgi:2-keto-4-pentenoate hydratase/2-oxohepta-3-ene-1,7-dioic acid hydratase in catechol pathway